MTTTFKRDVDFKPTDEELLARGKRLAEVALLKGDLIEEKKDAAEKFKAREKDLDRETGTLARAIRTGAEKRPVDCDEQPNVRRKLMEIVRMDTGEVIDSRPLTQRELDEAMQLKLDTETQPAPRH